MPAVLLHPHISLLRTPYIQCFLRFCLPSRSFPLSPCRTHHNPPARHLPGNNLEGRPHNRSERSRQSQYRGDLLCNFCTPAIRHRLGTSRRHNRCRQRTQIYHSPFLQDRPRTPRPPAGQTRSRLCCPYISLDCMDGTSGDSPPYSARRFGCYSDQWDQKIRQGMRHSSRSGSLRLAGKFQGCTSCKAESHLNTPVPVGRDRSPAQLCRYVPGTIQKGNRRNCQILLRNIFQRGMYGKCSDRSIPILPSWSYFRRPHRYTAHAGTLSTVFSLFLAGIFL